MVKWKWVYFTLAHLSTYLVLLSDSQVVQLPESDFWSMEELNRAPYITAMDDKRPKVYVHRDRGGIEFIDFSQFNFAGTSNPRETNLLEAVYTEAKINGPIFFLGLTDNLNFQPEALITVNKVLKPSYGGERIAAYLFLESSFYLEALTHGESCTIFDPIAIRDRTNKRSRSSSPLTSLLRLLNTNLYRARIKPQLPQILRCNHKLGLRCIDGRCRYAFAHSLNKDEAFRSNTNSPCRDNWRFEGLDLRKGFRPSTLEGFFADIFDIYYPNPTRAVCPRDKPFCTYFNPNTVNINFLFTEKTNDTNEFYRCFETDLNGASGDAWLAGFSNRVETIRKEIKGDANTECDIYQQQGLYDAMSQEGRGGSLIFDWSERVRYLDRLYNSGTNLKLCNITKFLTCQPAPRSKELNPNGYNYTCQCMPFFHPIIKRGLNGCHQDAPLYAPCGDIIPPLLNESSLLIDFVNTSRLRLDDNMMVSRENVVNCYKPFSYRRSNPWFGKSFVRGGSTYKYEYTCSCNYPIFTGRHCTDAKSRLFQFIDSIDYISDEDIGGKTYSFETRMSFLEIVNRNLYEIELNQTIEDGDSCDSAEITGDLENIRDDLEKLKSANGSMNGYGVYEFGHNLFRTIQKMKAQPLAKRALCKPIIPSLPDPDPDDYYSKSINRSIPTTHIDRFCIGTAAPICRSDSRDDTEDIFDTFVKERMNIPKYLEDDPSTYKTDCDLFMYVDEKDSQMRTLVSHYLNLPPPTEKSERAETERNYFRQEIVPFLETVRHEDRYFCDYKTLGLVCVEKIINNKSRGVCECLKSNYVDMKGDRTKCMLKLDAICDLCDDEAVLHHPCSKTKASNLPGNYSTGWNLCEENTICLSVRIHKRDRNKNRPKYCWARGERPNKIHIQPDDSKPCSSTSIKPLLIIYAILLIY